MIVEIWQSFRRLPLWVQIWVAGILVPVNLGSLLFLSEYEGVIVATLAVGGMAPNLVIMARDHGFSRAMAPAASVDLDAPGDPADQPLEQRC